MHYEYRPANTPLDENAGVKTWVVRWVTSAVVMTWISSHLEGESRASESGNAC